ncbi:Erp3p [Sugiyamaella lignohabitans]|uniref:Erp3p n=1 Tax=Sugiyamaella lignohabitans TaxID=796027 RepID=A0A161HI07_9ASCO|nr:Erp3p [Sugiyamaella lignohabitans]ANB15830.1 Erp3p [Sugiyamaella lignohabitans]
MKLLHTGSVLAALSSVVLSFPLTVKVPANDIECYYGQVHTVGAKVGFSYAVQAGGSFDIDLTIRGPDKRVIYEQPKDSQGEFAFAASSPGEYEFCFSNDMSTFSEKTVEFDISIDTDIKASLPSSVGVGDTDRVEQSISTIEDRTSSMLRSLHYYKTRNNRNESTVKSTEARIFYFSIFEVLLMVGMGVLHVTIVQLFFTGSRKQLV